MVSAHVIFLLLCEIQPQRKNEIKQVTGLGIHHCRKRMNGLPKHIEKTLTKNVEMHVGGVHYECFSVLNTQSNLQSILITKMLGIQSTLHILWCSPSNNLRSRAGWYHFPLPAPHITKVRG